MHELSFVLSDKTIAALSNGNTEKPLLVALHGWLDNAASFIPVSEFFEDYNVVAIDMIGHGKSSHRDPQAHYNLVDYLQDLYQLCQHQGWQSFFLVGHSLGGIVSSMFAAAFPEHVKKLVCIETAGPLTEPESTTVAQLRNSIVSRHQSLISTIKQPQSFTHIVRSRCKVSDLSAHNAELLLHRNTQVDDTTSTLMWRTDKRLRTLSSVRLTELQTQDLISHICCPCKIILGTHGFAKVSVNLDKRRAWFKYLSVDIIPGGHHVHMESCEQLASSICSFLERN